jgi:hypothetical protein
MSKVSKMNKVKKAITVLGLSGMVLLGAAGATSAYK